MAASAGAHIAPVVTLRKQADVIRQTLPTAVNYSVTTVKIGRPQLQEIVERAHYTPDIREAKFFSGRNQAGTLVGTVVFPQIDTQHGPLEVGVTIGPDGAVTSVAVTRASVETKPWILDVERSGVLDELRGAKAADTPKRLSDGRLTGMPGYMADVIATAAYRGLALYAVLRP
jgi:hypothetical protein